jgi:FkbM family methyltransferase
MRLKELIYFLGFKPPNRKYGFSVQSFKLEKDGQIDFAQWLHPSENTKTITQKAVDNMREILLPGDVALDIGAYTGDTALPMALAVGPKGHVLAFEPNGYVFPVLEKNASLNKDKTNIIPFMIAATAQDEDITFEYSDAGYCNGGHHEGISKWRHGHAFELTVKGKNIERLLKKDYKDLISKIKYIKIDAEGYDCVIVKSLLGLIKECRPYLNVEVFKKTTFAQRLELFETIKNCNYTIYRVIDEGDFQGEKVTAEVLMKWKHYDIFCVPEEKKRTESTKLS